MTPFLLGLCIGFFIAGLLSRWAGPAPNFSIGLFGVAALLNGIIFLSERVS